MGRKQNQKLFKGLLTINVLLVVLIFFTTNASADFYVIAGSRGVGTKITSLPYTIASSGFYFIDKNLTCATGTNGITITTDNVTLDLMGFSLIGPGGSDNYHGIYMFARTNVEIRKGTIRNFPRSGITDYDNGGKGHRIISIRVQDNGVDGIFLRGKGHLIEKCAATDNSIGIVTGSGSIATGNICNDNILNGLELGNYSIAIGNICYSNGYCGIITGTGTTVSRNTCSWNERGINVVSRSSVIGNTCTYNSAYGIFISGEYNLVDQNTAYSNTTTKVSMAGYLVCLD